MITNNTFSNSVIANTTGYITNTPSDTEQARITAIKSNDDVYMTSNEAEASNQTHIVTSFDITHALCVTSRNNLPSGYLHKFIVFAQLRRDDIASVIYLNDYPFTVPQRRLLSRV